MHEEPQPTYRSRTVIAGGMASTSAAASLAANRTRLIRGLFGTLAVEPSPPEHVA